MSPAELAAALVAWYRREARDLPWRGTGDPYRVWLSEVLLQQTQVATVEPYYQRFVDRFPTIAELAAAELDEVLALWSGLGYYRRAVNLHAAARRVVADHGGVLPADVSRLRQLPGVGAYTAGAVASIAFGLPEPAVDGNVNRVIARLAAIDGDPGRQPARGRIESVVRGLLAAAPPSEVTQGLMELGATICTPTRPDCRRCPVADGCAAWRSGEPTAWPHLPPRPAPRERLHVCAVIANGQGRLWGKRPPGGRWAGLWELPRVELPCDADGAVGLAAGLADLLGVTAEIGPPLAELRHAVSGERILLRAYRARIVAGAPRAIGYSELRWTAAPDRLAVPSPQRRLAAMVGSSLDGAGP